MVSFLSVSISLYHSFFVNFLSPALVVGMQNNEYTDAQVGDTGGLFKSLDPAPCGAVPAYIPHPVLQFQSSLSSAPVPVYLIKYFRSSLYLIHCYSSCLPVFWFHAVCLIHCSGSCLSHPLLQSRRL